MKSLLKDKILDLDFKLPQLELLFTRRDKHKAYTERKSKDRDRIMASDNHIASVMKKRYEVQVRSHSKKEKSPLKHVKRNLEDSPNKIKKLLAHIQPPASQQPKEEFTQGFKHQKLVLYRQNEKKKKRVDLGDLLRYNETKYAVLPNIKIPKVEKQKVIVEKAQVRDSVPCKYESVESIGELDFLRLFILEQLIYYLSQSNNHNREQMIGFCRIYLQNCDRESHYTMANVFLRRTVVEEAFILEKLSVYVILLLSNEESSLRETQNLIKSISICIHKNNLILLDLLMLIGEYQNIEITSQFHIFNTMRFNESRRRIFYSNDGIQLIKQNNLTLRSLLEMVTKSSKFESLSGFVEEILEGNLSFQEKLDDVLFVLYSFHQVMMEAENRDLPQPETPYLPPTEREYTLVLDLDETLIHTKEINGSPHFLIRPYCHDFLSTLAQHYEIVIFTASVKQYADTILDTLDKDKHITHRLYRQHTRTEDYLTIKDLSQLGRDLSKTIIIDNIPSNFKLQPRNGIYIATWTGSEEDCCLLNLIPVLELLVKRQARDVRDGLQNISKHMELMLKENKLMDLESIHMD